MSARGVLRIAEGDLLHFWCPGCKTAHGVTKGWTFNGDYEKPTFSPSVLVRGGQKDGVCHSFVRDGQIQFLGDCTHELANKTVPLEPF